MLIVSFFAKKVKRYYLGVKFHLVYAKLVSVMNGIKGGWLTWRRVAGLAILVFLGLLFLYNTPPASAKVVTNMTPTQQAKSRAYAEMFEYCIKGSFLYPDGTNGNRIKNENASNFRFWRKDKVDQTHKDRALGNYFLSVESKLPITGPDGQINCGSDVGTPNAWLKDAFGLWGISDPVKFLCDIGTKRAEGWWGGDANGDCMQLTDNEFKQISWSGVEDYLKKNVYGGKNIGMSSEAQYAYYRTTFFKGCTITDPVNGYTGRDRGDRFFEGVKIVQPDGKVKVMDFYSNGKKRSDQIWVSPTKRMTCE
ncbi:hypothetical protein CR969_01205 [Candidatus Saccharibacteria bacterium]|nr:MAG: hypothetical protein CR969_01205 [Candidatus Saccharibacteria bacterium]